MASPRPQLFPTSSFATVTDPTLHRHGWRSPRAPEPDHFAVHPRKIPNRFRSLLRYDALSPPPSSPRSPLTSRRETTTRAATAPVDHHHQSSPPHLSSSSSSAGEGDPSSSPSSAKHTNLDELQWFQHRWLDKHGKNSHLKEYREKLALLRRWFESLDADGSGEVGLDELEDPLVSVGLARSRDEVQRLIDHVDRDGSGEVTFHEFLKMMNPEKPTRARQRQPLHRPKPRAPISAEAEAASPRQGGRGGELPSAPPANPVVKLFEDLQSGKLGDLAIPFPVLITAYRRRMLLNAHMAEDATARRLGSSVLQALESTRREASLGHGGGGGGGGEGRGLPLRRGSVSSSSGSPSSYLKSYISTAEAAASENGKLPTLS